MTNSILVGSVEDPQGRFVVVGVMYYTISVTTRAVAIAVYQHVQGFPYNSTGLADCQVNKNLHQSQKYVFLMKQYK